MSPDSLNLLMILCTLDDGIFNLYNFTLSNIIQKFVEAFFCRLLNPSSLLRDSASKGALYMFDDVTDPLPVNLISCNMFLPLFLLSTTFISSLLLPSRVASIKIKMN